MTSIIAKSVRNRLYYIHATKGNPSAYSIVKAHKIRVLFEYQREKAMQDQQYVRQSSGAIAIDNRAALAKIRLLQLMAVIFTAALAGGLRLIFAH